MPLYALGDKRPTIHPDAFVHPQAVVIGNVTIGAGSSIWPGAVLRGDSEIIVGERTSIQDGAIIHCIDRVPTDIGDDCTVGHMAHMEGAKIGNGSLIGTGSIVLPMAVVGQNCIVGANAVVTQGTHVPDNSMVLGVPGKIREGVVDPDGSVENAEVYVERGKFYAENMTLIEG